MNQAAYHKQRNELLATLPPRSRDAIRRTCERIGAERGSDSRPFEAQLGELARVVSMIHLAYPPVDLSVTLVRAFLYNNQGFHEPPDWRAFDRIEVQPVGHFRRYDDVTGTERNSGFYERVENEESADMWSVYGHYRGGGVVCLSDISGGGPAQADAARELAQLFEGFIAECAGWGEIPRSQWDPHSLTRPDQLTGDSAALARFELPEDDA